MNTLCPRAALAALAMCMTGAAWADCPADLAAARSFAATVRVEIEAPQRTRVGEPLKVKWRGVRSARLGSPVYFVLVAAADVRFAGTGFIALTPGARGPHGLNHGQDGARALVPLHRATDVAAEGEVSVIPYRRGAQTVAWAVVTAGPCGEQAFAAASRAIEVGAGAPEIVVQDRFATQRPLQRVRSPAGTHELLIFQDRYEVHELATGDKILDRPGAGPLFSPTGRFLTALRGADDRVEVIDLLSATAVAEFRWGDLEWLRNDSYFAFSTSPGRLQVWNAIVNDGEVLDASLSCMACTGDDVAFVFDLDRGYLAAAGHEWRLVDLATRAAEPRAEVACDRADREWDRFRRTLEESKITDEVYDRFRRERGCVDDSSARGNLPSLEADVAAARLIRQVYDPDFRAFPKEPNRWSLGERRAAASRHPMERAAKAARPPAAQAKAKAKPAPTRVAAAPSGQLTGRARSGRGIQEADEPATALRPFAGPAALGPSVVFARMEAAGLATRRPSPLERIYLGEVWRYMNEVHAAHERASAAIAQRLRAEAPAARNLFRKSMQCFFDDAPENAVLIDPEYIGQVWKWREGGADRWLIQTICFGGAAGRAVSSDLYLLEPNRVSRVSDLLPEGLSGYEVGDEIIQLAAFRVSDRWLALASANAGIAVIADPAAGKGVAGPLPLIDGPLLAELRMSGDGRHLVQLNTDGRFFVHQVSDGKRVLIGAHVDDEIVVASADGLYDTTYEGAQAVQVRFPGVRGLHRFSQFEGALRRPGLAAAVLSGKAVAPPPATMGAPPAAELRLAPIAAGGRRTGSVIASAERELAAIRLYVDGRLAHSVDVGGTRVEVPVDLPDPGGGRWISAVAVDRAGLASLPSAVQIPGAPQARGAMRAVIVGVDQYQDPALPRLAYAKSDAQRFARALKASGGKLVREVRATPLLDADATPQRVLAAVREAAKATAGDDTLVVFYAGHGVDGRARGQADAGLVLTMPGTRMADLKGTALSWTALADALADARGTIVIVLDACHAGIAGADAFTTNDDAASALMTRAGSPMVVLAGSKGRQLSLETRQAGGGVFTAALAAAIAEARAAHDRDKSGLIDLGELYTAVKARVLEATKGRQTPWLARNGLVGEMALF